eukprot:c5826_g1_i2.p1 GENE.c5826_g1_i2~~c5826_g1_i2.p1  ORF type:complete len:267 (+),score=49.40 c5826_g1_i2:617-1417(+)
MASTLGPIVTVIVLEQSENKWHLDQLRTIIFIGLGLQLLSAVFFFFFKSPPKTTTNTSEANNTATQHKHHPAVPYIIFASSLVAALGSGMTVKFFSLYFKNDCHLSPSQVQIINSISPGMIVIFSVLNQKLSTYTGRVQAIVISRGAGVGCLLAMVFLQNHRGDWRVMVPIYIIRTALVNCSYPIEESILMDAVPQETRARWKSVESIASLGWSGSAALGGILADQHGYSFTFLITACLQAVSALLWLTLLPWVPKETKHTAELVE